MKTLNFIYNLNSPPRSIFSSNNRKKLLFCNILILINNIIFNIMTAIQKRLRYKILPYFILIIISIIISGCNVTTLEGEHHDPINHQYFLSIALDKESIQTNDSIKLIINYSIDTNSSSQKFLSLSLFMEDTVYNYSIPHIFRLARCSVYYKPDIPLVGGNNVKIFTLSPNRDFILHQGDCNCFPGGINNRTFKIFAEIPYYYDLKDSLMLTIGQNRYKVDYYYINDNVNYITRNYDIIRNSSSWLKLDSLFKFKLNTLLKYPSTNYYTGILTYEAGNNNGMLGHIINNYYLAYYLNGHGIPFDLQEGQYNKDKNILLGFDTIQTVEQQDSTVFGSTWMRQEGEDNSYGYCAFSLIPYPKLEAFFTNHNYSDSKKDEYRKAIIAHELGHGRSSNCFDHPQNSNYPEIRNCIMNSNIGINDYIISNPFTICNYHKFMIQRRFWYPSNLNLIEK